MSDQMPPAGNIHRPAQGGERSGGPEPERPAPARPTLLFVDDDTYMRRLMTARFEHLGAQVEPVAGAQAALGFLENHRPDLIVSDAVMPGMTGFDLCRRIKVDPLLQSIPFLILTALTRDLRQRSLDAGADDFLSKLEHEVVFRMRARLALELGVRGAWQEPLQPSGEASLLMVSGSKLVQTQLNTHLQKEGIQVVAAATLDAALERIQNRVPEAMALDLALDPDHLTDWIIELRRNPGCQALPIVVLAAKGEEDRLAALEYHVQDRLQKPLDGQESRHRLNYLMRIARIPAAGC